MSFFSFSHPLILGVCVCVCVDNFIIKPENNNINKNNKVPTSVSSEREREIWMNRYIRYHIFGYCILYPYKNVLCEWNSTHKHTHTYLYVYIRHRLIENRSIDTRRFILIGSWLVSLLLLLLLTFNCCCCWRSLG